VFHGPWRFKDEDFVVVSADPGSSEGWVKRIVPN
jgi:hypothetical protein